MLEHLRVLPLKRNKSPSDSERSAHTKENQSKEDQASTASDSKGNGSVMTSTEEVDRVSVVINETRKKSLKEVPNGVADYEKKHDVRKRYSISNGDLRSNGRTRELSPATSKQQQRKLSADMRVRGSNSQLTDDYLQRRPVRLKHIGTKLEAYDSLHAKSIDVSKRSHSI